MQRFDDTRTWLPQSHIAPPEALCSFAYATSSFCGAPSGKGFRSTLIAHENGCPVPTCTEFSRFYNQHRWADVEVAFKDVALHRSRVAAMQRMTDRSGEFFDDDRRKPDKNKGDVMIEAGAASVFDAASIEVASSSTRPSSAAFPSTCISGALPNFMIASYPPASAISCDMGGCAPPSRI